MKILLVEDDKFLVAAYKAKLSKAGFDLKVVLDGEEALAEVEGFMPDIILLDVMMPKKDGFAVLEELRKNPKFAKTPILIASNLGQKEDGDRAKSLGATGYMIKSDMSLDEIIKKITDLVPAGAAPAKAA